MKFQRPSFLYPLFSEITLIPGIGTKTFKLLENKIGKNVIDLLFHFPYTVINRLNNLDLKHCPTNSIITKKILITKHISNFYNSRRPYRLIGHCENFEIEIVFFNYKGQYIEKNFPVNSVVIVSGKINRFNEIVKFTNPDYIYDVSQIKKIPKFEPIYPLTAGINNKLLSKSIRHAIKLIPPDLPEWIPNKIIKENNWPTFSKALKSIHIPNTMIEVDNRSLYLQRLSFDEVFANQLGMQIYNKKYQILNIKKNKRKSKYFNKCLENLNFNLTNSQNECIEDLYSDLCSKTQMKRILQGDVGSGKTIVAIAAILNVIENSKQAALMAPTELLSTQHFNFIKNFTESLNIKVALITSKIDKNERISILNKISNGYVDIVIGTHSLISDRVTFNNLGIAVIDEQHKFGVIQRSKVLAKGENVHLLLLTATPIPRSLSMTVYGDLDLSEIKEKPKNRKKIITRVLPLEKYENVKLAISRALENEEKIYWVCPLLEETEKIDLVSLNNRFKILTKSFSKFNPTLVHGKMDKYEREKSIERFFYNESKILIASTVIEVGIDIPDATIIIIENAERFGLAQLHQLRGRVGRSSLQSYCILLYGKSISEVGKLRLKTMRDTDDGFFIAEKDLVLRGPGEIFGTRQSGEDGFKLLPFIDKEKLLLAKDLAIDIISKKNTLNFKHEVLVSLFNKDEYIKLMS